jgi:hypothetical protein
MKPARSDEPSRWEMRVTATVRKIAFGDTAKQPAIRQCYQRRHKGNCQQIVRFDDRSKCEKPSWSALPVKPRSGRCHWCPALARCDGAPRASRVKGRRWWVGRTTETVGHWGRSRLNADRLGARPANQRGWFRAVPPISWRCRRSRVGKYIPELGNQSAGIAFWGRGPSRSSAWSPGAAAVAVGWQHPVVAQALRHESPRGHRFFFLRRCVHGLAASDRR